MPGNDFAYYFNSILTQGKKDNTYKFALARFLIDYSYSQDQSVIETKIRNYETQTIDYSIIAKAFLRFYWHQICAYKIKQNPNPSKLPQIVHRIFGKKYIPELFEKMDKNKIQQAEVQITEECFREVIPRFQNISSGIGVVEQKVLYDYYENVKKIALKPEAMKYFKENHTLLLKATMLECAKFLERINKGLPMLISKIEGHSPDRGSLENTRKILSIYFDRCFYCNNLLSQDKRMVQVDHVIPWSYIYEDEIWNLVLSCKTCNCKKHSSLPSDQFIERLMVRDIEYSDKIELLKKSLLKLDSESRYENAIRKHYRGCMDYGFTVINDSAFEM